MAISKKICILGNYSGRNAGDAAILAGILHDLSARYNNVEFIVPTLNPQFILRSYDQFRVKPIDLSPWKGCIKLLGYPAFKAIRSSDLILITDAILFDRALFNPLHNYLSTLAWLIPRAKRKNIPVVLYNVSLGPIRTWMGRWCLERVLRNIDLLILRDDESKKILDLIGTISAPVLKGADSALSAAICGPGRIKSILQKEGISDETHPRVGVNISCYGEEFIKRKSKVLKEEVLSVLSKIAEWIHYELKAEVWLFGTQQMDIKILKELQNRIQVNNKVRLFTNKEYSYAEITGLFSMLELLIGMRTHSLILASSVGVPVVGIVNYPKTYGYMERIGQEKQAILIQELELERLQSLILACWNSRSSTRKSMVLAVEQQRQLARNATNLLKPYLEG